LGIWIAPYASPFAMRCTILLWGLRLTLFAVTTGLVAAFGLGRPPSSFLFGVKPSSAVAFLVPPAILGAFVLMAKLPTESVPRFRPLVGSARQVARSTQRLSYMNKPGKPTEAELSILGVLWHRGPSTVGQVRDAINASKKTSKETGYTTVLKLMQIMTGKGLVTRDETLDERTGDSGIVVETRDPERTARDWRDSQGPRARVDL
jgi:hypothetical protein